MSVLSGNVALGDYDEEDWADGRPPAPEDRTWRHPSEVAWEARQSAAPIPAVDDAGDSGQYFGPLWALGGALIVGAFWLASSGNTGVEIVTQRIAATPVESVTPRVTSETDWSTEVSRGARPSTVLVRSENGMETLAGAVAVRDDGYLITSGQALNGGTAFLIHSAGGIISEATLVGTDPITDISVLRTTTSIAPAVMAGSPPEDGSSVAVIDPTGGAQRHTIESTTAVSTKADGEHLVGVHTLTEALGELPPGSVAVDDTGAVVGIAVATNPDSPAAFVPIDVADAIATEIIANGVITHVRIGVTARDPEGAEVGSVVTAVVRDGPAAVGGVFPADSIIGIGDHGITSMAEMVSVLRTYEPGDSVEIMVDRDGDHIACRVVLGSDTYDGA